MAVVTFSNIKGGGGSGAPSGITFLNSDYTLEFIESAVTEAVDSAMTAYTRTEDFATINGSAITEGGNIEIDGTAYSAGTNIDITDNVISVTGITVPTKVSELQNDEGFITTADTQNFVTSGDVQTQINESISGKADSSAVTAQISEVKTEIEAEIPSKVSDLQNDLNFASTGDVESMISGFTTSADVKTQIESYNYINSGQAQTQIDNSISGKVDTSAMSAYTPTSGFSTINGSAITSGDNLVIEGTPYSGGTGIGVENHIISVTGDYETVVELTQAEYDALTAYSENTTYIITDAPSVNMSAYTPTSGFSTINGSAITSGGNITIEEVSYSGGTNINISDHVISVTGITVPTKLSDLQNDEGFITTADTQNFVTSGDVKTQIEGYNYVNSGDVQSQINDSISGKVDTSAMTAYWTSAETESAISSATEDFVTSAEVETQITDKGYITGYTETDPVFQSSPASGISAQDILDWDAKLDSSDLEPYYTSAQTNTAIANAVSGKADADTFTAYTPTSGFATINGSAITEGGSIVISGGSGSEYSAGTNINIDENNVISVTGITEQIQDVEGHINDVEEVTAEALINLQLNKVDTSAMTAYATSEHLEEVEEVTAEALNNLQTNKVDTSALTEYATTAHVDEIEEITASALTELKTTKLDSTALTQYYTSAQTDTAIANATSGLQETLVSGTNIKTINNESILGSGNIVISGGSGSANIIELTQVEYDALTAYTEDAMYVITDAQEINMDNYATTGDLGSYYTSAQTDTAISNAVSGKTDKVSVTANTGRQFPRWNSQGVVTGTTGNTVYEQSLNINGTSKTMLQTTNSSFGTIYAPTTAGSAGQPLLSNGSGAPVWGSYKLQFLSQSQYDALATKDSTTIYFIVNEN